MYAVALSKGETSIALIRHSARPFGVTFFQVAPPSRVRDTTPSSLPVQMTPFSWGDSITYATTHLLDLMHYTGLLRIVRRDKGIRVYAVHEHEPVPRGAAERRARVDALVDEIGRAHV